MGEKKKGPQGVVNRGVPELRGYWMVRVGSWVVRTVRKLVDGLFGGVLCRNNLCDRFGSGGLGVAPF